MGFASLNDMPCLEPVLFARNVANIKNTVRNFLDVAGRVRLAGLTNRFLHVSGKNPSYGYFAVTRETVEKIKNENVELVMKCGEVTHKFSGLRVVKATSMAPVISSATGDSDAFVVEIADKRYFGTHPRMKLNFGGYKMFNVPAPAYGKDQYYEDTINPDTTLPWTWQEMFDELWPSYLGTAPTLADTLTADPVGFDFRAFTNYQAISIVLDHLCLELALDNDGTFYTVNHGTRDETSITNEAKEYRYRNTLSESIEYIDPVAQYYPKGVDVLFQKTSINSGSENVFTKESGQWYTDMYHTETIDATDAQLSQLDRSYLMSNTYHQIYDDMPCWVDPYTGVVQNQADITTRAQERMTSFYSDLIKGVYRYHKLYSYLVPLDLCGTLQAIGFIQQQERGGAWTTEVWCYPGMQMRVSGGDIVPESVKPVSPWQWRSAPIYPPETMIWRNDGLLTSGSAVATRDDEYNGVEIRYDPVTKQYVEGIYVKGVPTP